MVLRNSTNFRATSIQSCLPPLSPIASKFRTRSIIKRSPSAPCSRSTQSAIAHSSCSRVTLTIAPSPLTRVTDYRSDGPRHRIFTLSRCRHCPYRDADRNPALRDEPERLQLLLLLRSLDSRYRLTGRVAMISQPLVRDDNACRRSCDRCDNRLQLIRQGEPLQLEARISSRRMR